MSITYRNTTSSSSNASVGATGTTAPTSATEIGYINGSGNLVAVTSSAGLPISGSITASNASIAATGAAVPASATYLGVNNGGNIVGVAQGQALMASSLPVVIASNQSSLTVSEAALDAALIAQEATTSGIKGITTFGAVTTAAPSYTNAKSDALSLTTGGALRGDITTIAGTAPTTAGFIDVKGADGNVFVRQATASNLNATVVGAAASGASVSGNPLYIGGQARSTEQTAVTSGQAIAIITDLVGKQIIMPYANKENLVKGNATSTGTSDTSVISAAAGSLKNYVTGGTVYNSGSSTSVITVKDGSGGSTLFTTIAPAGSGSNFTLPTPIAGTAATAVYFASGTASTTVGVSLTGYTGT